MHRISSITLICLTATLTICCRGSFSSIKQTVFHPQEALVTNLLNAVKRGEIEKVRSFLRLGVSPEHTICTPNPIDQPDLCAPALVLATQAGHTEMVKLLLAYGANPNALAQGRIAGELHAVLSLMSSIVVEPPDCAMTLDSMVIEGMRQDNTGVTALMVAALQGKPELVRALVQKGANPNLKSADGATAPMFAAINGSPSIIQSLITTGAEVNAKTLRGQTALMLAAWKPETFNTETLSTNDAAVTALLSAGAIVNTVDQDGNNALLGAVGQRAPSCVYENLLSHGANLHSKNHAGVTPLMNAAARAPSKVVAHLITRGAPLEERDNEGATALLHARNSKNAKVLLDAGADINAQDHHGTTALMLAVTESPRDLELVRLLLQRQADVKQQDNQGKTALMKSVGWHQGISVTKLLLAYGASVHQQDHRGWTALFYAANDNQAEYIKLLLAHGARISHQAQTGETAVSVALTSARIEELHSPRQAYFHLKAAGSKLSNKDKMVLAVRTGDEPTAMKMLGEGISPNLRGSDSRPLLTYAAESGYVAICEILLKAGADINGRDYQQATALMWAAFNGKSSSVECLLAHGAQTELQDRFQETALAKAASKNHQAIVAKLVAAGSSPQPKK